MIAGWVVGRKRSPPRSEVRSSSCVGDRALLMKLWFVDVLWPFITGSASDVFRERYIFCQKFQSDLSAAPKESLPAILRGFRAC